MSPSLCGGIRKKILTSSGIGYHTLLERHGMRKKKRVRGNTITEDIYQINLIITKKGNKKIEEILVKSE